MGMPLHESVDERLRLPQFVLLGAAMSAVVLRTDGMLRPEYTNVARCRESCYWANQ
jgi:hypothetical protein